MDERFAYWFAALIDGEGSIYVRTRPGRRHPAVTITVAQNDRRLLDQAATYIGCGRVYSGIGPRRIGHQLQINRQADALRVLRSIEPLLVLKGDAARRAIGVLTERLAARDHAAQQAASVRRVRQGVA